MSTFSYVRRFINQLPPRRIFVTRELLTYGSRKNIDWITSFLVATDEIVRLARGVFVKFEIGMVLPSIQEIAEAKARAFGKKIIPTMANHAEKYGLSQPYKFDARRKQIPDEDGVAQYSVVGCKSDFNTIHGRVKFKNIAPRKFFLNEEKVGKLLLALWHATDRAVFCYEGFQQKYYLNRIEKLRLRRLSAWAPAWLQYYLFPNPPRADIHAPSSIWK